jgi:hypothetical protein
MVDRKIYIVLFLLFVISILLLLYINLQKPRQPARPSQPSRPTQSSQQIRPTQQRLPNNTNQPVLKLYYANWCGWSKKYLPVWDQLKAFKKLNIPMEKIDCEKNKEQCNGIPGFPYVVLETRNKRIEYKGNRTARDIENFVKNNV